MCIKDLISHFMITVTCLETRFTGRIFLAQLLVIRPITTRHSYSVVVMAWRHAAILSSTLSCRSPLLTGAWHQSLLSPLLPFLRRYQHVYSGHGIRVIHIYQHFSNRPRLLTWLYQRYLVFPLLHSHFSFIHYGMHESGSSSVTTVSPIMITRITAPTNEYSIALSGNSNTSCFSMSSNFLTKSSIGIPGISLVSRSSQLDLTLYLKYLSRWSNSSFSFHAVASLFFLLVVLYIPASLQRRWPS